MVKSGIKIFAWNLWGGRYLPGIIDFIRVQNPDVIGLQEVVEDLDGSNNIAESIARSLGYQWSFVPSVSLQLSKLASPVAPPAQDRKVTIGNAVLSKFPIIKSTSLVLSDQPRRIDIRADIDVRGKILSIFSVHLIHTHQQPSEIQASEAKKLLEFAPAKNSVVLGDFNALPDSRTIEMVSEVLKNNGDLTPPTWSVYPAGCPICNPPGIIHRLDYIFTTKDLSASAFAVGQSKASDHLPISAVLEI